MSATSPLDPAPPIVRLHSWFQTPVGLYVRQWEQARLDALVEDAFGFVAVQVGLPTYNALRNNRIPLHIYVGEENADLPSSAPESGPTNAAEGRAAGLPPTPQHLIRASAQALPLASQSVDLLILPHVLEYAEDPHTVLREAERVLVPEGRLIIVGFNPWSLWGLRQRLRHPDWLPESGRFLALPRLKDWLKLLSFDLDRGHFGCYGLPMNHATWLRRLAFLDKAGDRWWPLAGAVYIIAAVKRQHGMRLVGQPWKGKRRRMRARAQVAVNSQPRSTHQSSHHE